MLGTYENLRLKTFSVTGTRFAKKIGCSNKYWVSFSLSYGHFQRHISYNKGLLSRQIDRLFLFECKINNSSPYFS